MMKSFHFAVAITIFVGLTSFHKIPSVKKVPLGTYGVCDCEGGQPKKNVLIELKLNQDHSFHYIDNSDAAHKLDMSGSWSLEHDKVVLENTSGHAIHDTWHVDKTQKCIKSRKGMNFRRLCLITPC